MRRTTESASRAGAAIEDVAFDTRAVFAGDGDVAAIVEGFLQRIAQFGFAGEIGDPAFDLVALAAVDDFEMVGSEVALGFGHK